MTSFPDRVGPAWLIASGLEWFWRLLLEPKRLAKRYLLGNPAFLLRQELDRGIVAAGWFTSDVYPAEHWDGSGRQANYAEPAEGCGARGGAEGDRGDAPTPPVGAGQNRRSWSNHSAARLSGVGRRSASSRKAFQACSRRTKPRLVKHKRGG